VLQATQFVLPLRSDARLAQPAIIKTAMTAQAHLGA
jgi:hypothetical protein